jgi:hypothetical protein
LATTKATVQFKLAGLVHGGGKQELESLLDLGRLGVEEGGEGLTLGGSGWYPARHQFVYLGLQVV